MSEPEGKQYLLESIEHCREALSALDSTENSPLETQKKTIGTVVEQLEALKEKVFFKTKKAIAPAFQVKEASEAVAEQAGEIDGSDEDAIREFGDAVSQLRDSSSSLEAASKTQSVIVT